MKIIFLIFFVSWISFVNSLRCYRCNSETQLNCGDPFYPQAIPVEECGTINTFASFLCYKANHYVGGRYVSSRGCAPFDPETFDPQIQRSMTGTYWKSAFTGNMISFCDYNNCNGGEKINTKAMSSLIMFILGVYIINIRLWKNL